MSLNGEHLTQFCDDQGIVDGTLGRPFSPPVDPRVCPDEADVYAHSYWTAVHTKPIAPPIEPDKALVRRAKRLAKSRHG